MAIKIPAFLTSEPVKKALSEVGILSVSGLLCTLGSYVVVTRLLKPPVASVSSVTAPAAHAATAPHGEAPAVPPDVEAAHETTAHEPAGETKKETPKKAEKEEKGHNAKAGASASAGPDTHLALKPVIVNLLDPSARRYAKMTLTLDLTTEKVKESIAQREPEVYDALIKILGNYRFDEINTSTGKEALKEEIKSRLNLILKGGVASVYLTEMIVQ